MSKPMLVTLPFVLLLLDYWPLGRLEKKTVWNLAAEKVPFFLLSIADCVITFNAQKSGRAINEGVPLSYHLAATVVSYARYLGKLFWPSSLAVHYPQPAHWPAATVLLAVVLLLGISLAVFRWRGRAWLAVGWFWFLGMLVPVIGLVGIGGLSIADRYAYLPSVGVIIMVVWGMAEGTKLWPRREIILGSALGVALLGCLALTRRQLGFWQDSGTLFQHAIEVTGDNDLACAKLADYYFHENRPDEAMAL